MTWEDKFDAINGLAIAALHMRYPGNWFVAQPGVEMKNMGLLRGVSGNGPSPQEAVEAHWEELTSPPPGQYIVVGAYRANRRAVRWSGHMWSDVMEPS